MGVNALKQRVDKDQVKVLEVIANKKCSYKSEIAKETGLSNDKTGRILNELYDAEVIERIYPGEYASLDDVRLLDRRNDFWAEGKRGNNKDHGGFRKPNFYGLNTDLSWILKVKDENFYVDEFHERVYDDPDKSTMELLKEKTSDEAYV